MLESIASIRDHAHTNTGGSMLIWFCKNNDLRQPEFAAAVREISTWIDSPDEYFRHAVSFALCFGRPVAGYEWVAVEGFKRASVLDLHWEAGAIESSFKRREQITPDLLDAIAARLNKPTLTELDYVGKQFDFEEALSKRDLELESIGRALLHLRRVFELEQTAPLEELSATALAETPRSKLIDSDVQLYQSDIAALRAAVAKAGSP